MGMVDCRLQMADGRTLPGAWCLMPTRRMWRPSPSPPKTASPLSLRERNEGGKRRPLFVAGLCGATSLAIAALRTSSPFLFSSLKEENPAPKESGEEGLHLGREHRIVGQAGRVDT